MKMFFYCSCRPFFNYIFNSAHVLKYFMIFMINYGLKSLVLSKPVYTLEHSQLFRTNAKN